MKNRFFSILVLFFCVASSVISASASENNLADLVANHSGNVLQLNDGTYTVTKSIYVPSDLMIIGSGNTTILGAYSDFNTEGAGMFVFDGVSGSGISDLTIDGGERESQYKNSGHGHENAIVVNGGAHELEFDNIVFTGLAGDGVRGKDSYNVTVSGCKMDKVGHDGVQNWDGDNWIIKNNYMNLFINSGVRIANSNGCIVTDNYFTSNTNSGFSGVELEDNVNGTEILNNTFEHIHSHRGIGIATVHAKGTVNIYGNVFNDCPGGNIKASGITITAENNTYINENGTNECDDMIKLNDNCTDDTESDEDIKYISQAIIDALRDKIVGVASMEGTEDMDLSGQLYNSSTETLLRANSINVTDGDESIEYINTLLNDSAVKDDMAFKLASMAQAQHNEMRKVIRYKLSSEYKNETDCN